MRCKVSAVSSLVSKASPGTVAPATLFLGRLVRWRRVVKVDAMELVVRTCSACSAGKSKKASSAAWVVAHFVEPASLIHGLGSTILRRQG